MNATKRYKGIKELAVIQEELKYKTDFVMFGWTCKKCFLKSTQILVDALLFTFKFKFKFKFNLLILSGLTHWHKW